jgi:hypothetical protein
MLDPALRALDSGGRVDRVDQRGEANAGAGQKP